MPSPATRVNKDLDGMMDIFAPSVQTESFRQQHACVDPVYHITRQITTKLSLKYQYAWTPCIILPGKLPLRILLPSLCLVWTNYWWSGTNPNQVNPIQPIQMEATKQIKGNQPTETTKPTQPNEKVNNPTKQPVKPVVMVCFHGRQTTLSSQSQTKRSPLNQTKPTQLNAPNQPNQIYLNCDGGFLWRTNHPDV